MVYNLFNDAMPMGFGMALACNSLAFDRFSSLTEKERAELMGRTRGIRSPEEMRAFVDAFANGKLE